MTGQGPAPRGRTALALMAAGALAAGGGAAIATAQSDEYPVDGCDDHVTYPGGEYPGGDYPGYPGYPSCPPPPTVDTTTTTTTTAPVAEAPRVAARVTLRLPSNRRLRVPKGGLLNLGTITCQAGAICPDVTVALGKPRKGARSAALPGSYARKVVKIDVTRSQALRVRVKASAVRAMLRRKNRRLGARLVVSNPAAAPIVRTITLTR